MNSSPLSQPDDALDPRQDKASIAPQQEAPTSPGSTVPSTEQPPAGQPPRSSVPGGQPGPSATSGAVPGTAPGVVPSAAQGPAPSGVPGGLHGSPLGNQPPAGSYPPPGTRPPFQQSGWQQQPQQAPYPQAGQQQSTWQPQNGWQQPAPSQAQAAPRPPVLAGFFGSLRRSGLVRTQDRWVGGVAGGVARRLGVDPVIVRSVWVVLSVFTGLGLVLYGLGWALMPEEKDGRIHLQQALIGDVDAGLAGAIATFVAGWALADQGLVPSWYMGAWTDGTGLPGVLWALFWVGLIALVVLGVVRGLRGGHQAPPAQGQWPVPGASGEPFLHSQAAPGTSAPQGVPGSGPASTQPSVPTSGPVAASPVSGQGPAPTAAFVPPVGPVSAAQAVPPVSTPTGGLSNGPTPPPSVYAAAPQPRRPRRPGPGRSLSLIALGLALMTVAGCALAYTKDTLGPIGALLVCAGCLVLILGSGVLLAGVLGRRGGWMSWLGWPALLLAVPALVLGSALPVSTVNAPHRHNEVTITVTSEMLQDAQGGQPLDLGTYSAASVTLDLRQLKDPELAKGRISVTVGLGQIQVLSTQGQSLKVNASSGIGPFNGEVGDGWTAEGVSISSYWDTYYETYDVSGQAVGAASVYNYRGLSTEATLLSPAAQDKAPALTLDLSVGAGSFYLQEYASTVQWAGFKTSDYWIVSWWDEPDGTSHQGSEAPVPGMGHRAVDADNVHSCITQVLPDQTTEDGAFVDISSLDLLPADQRAQVDACVDKAISAAAPSASAAPQAATPAPTASTQPDATAAPTAAPTN